MSSEEKKGQAPIPKFSSFKPKPAPVTRPDDDRSKRRHHIESDDLPRELDSQQRAAERRKRSRDRDHDRSPRRDHDDRPSRAKHSPVPGDRRRDNKEDTSLYIVDKKGDRYNLVYGSLHRYDVPDYRRSGSGRVLGLSGALRIDRSSEDGKSLIIQRHAWVPEEGHFKSRRASWRHAAKESGVRRLRRRSPSPSDSELQKDFLPINYHGSSKRRRILGPTSAFESAVPVEDDGPDYRSIQGRAKPEVDPDIISESEVESDTKAARNRNAELTRLVSDRSDDVDAWLELINHQENLVGRASSEGQRILTSAEKRSVADIKFSLYEKALRKVPSHGARDRLLVGMMEEGSKICDSKTLSTKWKNVLRSNPGYISLWVKYLNFQQTQFLTFTYEQCKSCFIECLKLNQTPSASHKQQVIDLYLVLRLSLFMLEAGFAEHAVSLWQALLEFNFCRPKSLDLSRDLDAARSSFGEFWESEAPRIGEAGAKGWDNANTEPLPPRVDPQLDIDIDERSIFESWVQKEETCALSSRLPARTLDEVREDDPYRVILFSDIADFLLPFSQPGLSALLIDSFLLFCRLPPLGSQLDTESVSWWRGDPFICNLSSHHSHEWFSPQGAATPDSPDENSPLNFTSHNFVSTAHTFFADGKTWVSSLDSWKNSCGREDAAIDIQWVRQTIRQLVDRFPDNEDLAEYSVAIEYSLDAKEAKKYAKSLLRKRSSSLKLYNAYALVEAREGQIAAAEKVWTATLALNDKFGEDSRGNTVLLWISWVWETLQNGQRSRALRLLLSVARQSLDRDEFLKSLETEAPVNVAEFLKAQRWLGDIQAYAITFSKPQIISSSTECLALLTYLSKEGDIEGVLDVYKAIHSRLDPQNQSHSLSTELILQAKARLLYYHARSSRLYKPALIRAELIDSIRRFPHNTIFLAMFTWNESRFRIEDRVRSVLRQYTLSTNQESSEDFLGASNVIPYLFSIWSELHRGVSEGSTVHSVRATFEMTVTSNAGQSSIAAWKLYIFFELTIGDKKRAKDVFYRALRACPWAKELVLLAFTEKDLRDSMGRDELRKVWNVLVEKELRIHVDLEVWFEENEDQGRELAPIDMPYDKSSDEEEHGRP